MSEATLGFKIDSSQASAAAADLDRLTSAAARTQQAADKLQTEAASLGGSLSRAAEGAGKAAPPMERMAKSLTDQDEHVRAFRMEVERLTLKYQPLAQATRNYEIAIGEIERAHKIGAISAQQMQKALDGERLAYERLKTSAISAGQAMSAANANQRRGGNYQTAGITAQFQDIAVSAAFGNPLQVGLQQGTQLGEILKTLRKEGEETSGVMDGLADAATSLFDPVALLSIGLTTAAVAAYQYFFNASDEAEEAKRLFEDQNDQIRRATELWGDAAPALKAYVDQLDRVDKLTQGKQAGEILAGRELDGLSENLNSIQKQGVAAFRALQGDPSNAVVIRDLREAWGDLRDRLDDGTASMSDLNRVQSELANAVSQYGVPAVLDFKDAFDKVTASIYRGVEAAQKARTEWIKAIAGGTNVQDIVTGSTFTDGGRTLRPSDFVPLNVPVPGRRPLELDQDPGAPTILNGDGRLTNVPVPGQKPNFFEIDNQTDKVTDLEKAYRRAQEAKADFWLDISFQQRQAERSAMDQQVAGTLNRYGFNEDLNSPEANTIRQQLRGQQAKEIANDFGNAFSSELISGSHDIGKAFLKGFEAAITSQASDLWKKFFDSIGNLISGLLTGGKGGGSISGAASLATSVFGGAANDNMGRAPVIPVARAPLGDIASYISSAATARGIDPDIALRVAKSEGGLGSWNLQSGYSKNGFREPSYGPFQLLKGGKGTGFPTGLGNSFMARTGLDPADAANGPAGVDFALDHAAKNGWGAWYGAGKAGIGNFEGIGGASKTATDAVNKLANSAGSASQGLNQFGSGLSQAGQSLASGVSGGGGGLLSALSGVGKSIFASSAQFASAWKLGGIGLYADGTNYAPGGLSIVGERGPELVNLPQGSQVFNTNRSAQMMGAGNDNGSSSPRKLEVHVHGGSGDEHVRELARQGAQEALYQDKIDQARGGFGNTQKKFNSRVG